MLQFTEEELGEIIELTEEMCTRNGWVNEIVPPAKKRMEIITRARSRPHPAPANPCEENGCTDIENCDEICEHSRIYSPVQVAEKVKAERVRVVRRFHDAAELGVRELLDALDYEEQTLLGGEQR